MSMPDLPPTTVVGCLLDVSGSMRKCLESGRSDERAGERLFAVLRAALKLAQAEQRRDSQALVFIGVFGLNTDKCPSVVDLCAVLERLLDGYDGHQTGHNLLVSLANQNSLEHITKYIRTKLTDDEARIVYAYLKRHPHRVQEFVDAVPSETRMKQARKNAKGLGAVVTGAVCVIAAASTGVTMPFVAAVAAGGGFAAGYEAADTAVDFAEDDAVEKSKALELARSMCKEWWQACEGLVPRLVNSVVDLLHRVQEHPVPSANGSSDLPDTRSALDVLHPYLYGPTPMQKALYEADIAFTKYHTASHRMLVLISDGVLTDGDPQKLALELQRQNVTLATVYLTDDRRTSLRRLNDRAVDTWNEGQRKLFDMASTMSSNTHPIRALISMGWGIPSSGECVLHASLQRGSPQ
jgi:hypothetical protein